MTNESARKIKPSKNIAHFVNFLNPRSFETWNKSRSLEPISAPEKEFECGDISSEIKIIKTPKIAIKVRIIVFNIISNR